MSDVERICRRMVKDAGGDPDRTRFGAVYDDRKGQMRLAPIPAWKGHQEYVVRVLDAAKAEGMTPRRPSGWRRRNE
jgi:hypothetical protein